ncbi:tetratricopeptide repeat protein [Pseudomonas sp. FP453]|jgi:Flp pilus assembly protein TadD|uniref:tetratricopeptide repeat protein n=1 Tax=unclassified Pseudomonas TaxID=196821 RepID=UPI00034767FC|nr:MULTISPECIES: tetratricopeptide repeat protein [unclassified Pseudomonas]WLH91063.1 tetratricopeptide repeat protein [Pseudomonas sp. FP453]
MKLLIAACSVLLISGCANMGQTPWSGFAGASSCSKPSSDQELSLNLADEMANDGKLHASLANLQNMTDNLPQVRLRKAKVYRLLGRSEAEPMYRSLLGTCMAAEGEHGLGQLAVARGDNGQALEHLQRAARLSPTDEKIRNDLGVVYLNQLRMEDARFEFLTAMELNQSNSLAAVNMVTLLIYQNNWKQASQFVSRFNLSPEQFNQAQARAEQLKGSATRAKGQVATVK